MIVGSMRTNHHRTRGCRLRLVDENHEKKKPDEMSGQMIDWIWSAAPISRLNASVNPSSIGIGCAMNNAAATSINSCDNHGYISAVEL
ncbi:hypothetical protein TNCV_1002751 [Trichonephila clavipes]|nr:hypothetical protein TNCV_1002751 [Trichonephila clavipes]